MKLKLLVVRVCIVVLVISSDCFSQNQQIILMATGDIFLARLPGKHLLASSDLSFPFTQVRKYFLASDIAFANLECPILEFGTPYPGKPENITLRTPLKAPRIIDAGASTILGHHPHVLQGIELHNNGVIL